MPRPRKIEKDDALDAAMQTFWRKGYEATSLQDLMQATGLQKGSLYQTFGDKKALFMAAFNRYADRAYNDYKDYFDSAPSAKVGMQGFLTEKFVDFAYQDAACKGCFVVNTAIELAPHDPDARAVIHRQSARMEKMLAGVIKAGQDAGDFRTDISADALAVELNIIMSGLMADSKSSSDRNRTKSIAMTFLRSLTP